MIDLHSHTDQSDGTFSPEELVAEAVRIGLRALAITDHDTFAGVDLAVPFAARSGLELIGGIELSTKFGGASVHLLGYFPCQPSSAEFRDWLDFLLESRRDRNRRLIERLRSLGIDITLAEVEQMGRSLTGRPHFARVLVEKGFARRTFRTRSISIWMRARRAYVQRHEVPIEEAIERIVAAGGVASLAHPVRVAKNNWEKITESVEELSAWVCGRSRSITAITAPENVAFYRSLAERFQLAYDRRLGFPRRQQAEDFARHRDARESERSGLFA